MVTDSDFSFSSSPSASPVPPEVYDQNFIHYHIDNTLDINDLGRAGADRRAP